MNFVSYDDNNEMIEYLIPVDDVNELWANGKFEYYIVELIESISNAFDSYVLFMGIETKHKLIYGFMLDDSQNIIPFSASKNPHDSRIVLDTMDEHFITSILSNKDRHHMSWVKLDGIRCVCDSDKIRKGNFKKLYTSSFAAQGHSVFFLEKIRIWNSNQKLYAV